MEQNNFASDVVVTILKVQFECQMSLKAKTNNQKKNTPDFSAMKRL